jgi:hypothetical protein
MTLYTRVPRVRTLVGDAFAGAAASDLAAHVSEWGSAWTVDPNSVGTLRLSGTGTVYNPTVDISNSGVNYIFAQVIPRKDYLLRAFLTDRSGLGGTIHGAGLISRVYYGLNNRYTAWWNTQVSRWELYRGLGGGAITLGTSLLRPLVNGIPALLGLRAKGANIQLLVDGYVLISAVNADVPAQANHPVQAGIRMYNDFASAVGTVNTGLHIGRVQVVTC